MSAREILLCFFMLLAGLSATAIVFSKNVFMSALFLLCCLLSVSALYVLSFAEFLAVTQILIYAGGILVIIIFGIMLTTRLSGRSLVVGNTNIVSGALAGMALFVLLIRYLPSTGPVADGALSPGNIADIGLTIFSEYSLPFEIAGLLLLIALVGAAVITSHLKSKT